MTTKRIKLDDIGMVGVVGGEMLEFLKAIPSQAAATTTTADINNTLQRLEANLACVKTSIEKKKQYRVTLSDVNRKLNQILDILSNRKTGLNIQRVPEGI